jgi:hypothetical protein
MTKLTSQCTVFFRNPRLNALINGLGFQTISTRRPTSPGSEVEAITLSNRLGLIEPKDTIVDMPKADLVAKSDCIPTVFASRLAFFIVLANGCHTLITALRPGLLRTWSNLHIFEELVLPRDFVRSRARSDHGRLGRRLLVLNIGTCVVAHFDIDAFDFQLQVNEELDPGVWR